MQALPRMSDAITSIHVEGFRSLRNVTLEPGRVTVLIGPNGAGKSNLLSVLKLAALLRTRSLARFVREAGGAGAILHYGPKTTQEVVLRLEFEQEHVDNAYEVRLRHAADNNLYFADEQIGERAPGQAEFAMESLGTAHVEAHISDDRRETARQVRGSLSRTSFFHFHDTSAGSALRGFGRQEDARYLRSDGSNLASFLYALATSESDEARSAWTRIHGLVRLVAPFIKTLEPALVAPDLPDASAVRLDWIDDRDERFGPHQLSDGTLRAIALITALAQPTRSLPAFIAIDEPELGLHPAAIGLLAGLVKSVSAHCQVLLATQSPAFLDYFDVHDVVVVEHRDGETSLARLDAAQLEIWREDYSLSELWDKNLLGGRP